MFKCVYDGMVSPPLSRLPNVFYRFLLSYDPASANTAAASSSSSSSSSSADSKSSIDSLRVTRFDYEQCFAPSSLHTLLCCDPKSLKDAGLTFEGLKSGGEKVGVAPALITVAFNVIELGAHAPRCVCVSSDTRHHS